MSNIDRGVVVCIQYTNTNVLDRVIFCVGCFFLSASVLEEKEKRMRRKSDCADGLQECLECAECSVQESAHIIKH